MAVVGRVAGWFPIDYNAPTWPRLIIWEGDQMIWDGQLGPSVATSFMILSQGDMNRIIF